MQESAGENEYQIFLSHASPDVPFVEAHLLPILEDHRDRIFYSPEAIKGGEDWENLLREQLDASGRILVVISREALDPRRYVRSEVAWWVNEHPDGAGMITVLIDDSSPQRLQMKLIHKHHVDFREPSPESARKLREALETAEPATPVIEKIEFSVHDPELRRSYLRWLIDTHRAVEVTIAGERVTAPITEAPMADRFAEDEATGFGREQEARNLDDEADAHRARDAELDDAAAEVRAVSEQPLPLFLGANTRLDALGLEDKATRSADDLARHTWRAVVLGDPGAGKSTVARRLAVDVARERLDGPPVPRALDRLPILCRAGDLARLLQNDEAPVEELAISAGWEGKPLRDVDSGDPLPVEDLRALARTESAGRRLLLIVDGLDEVATRDDRRRVVDAVEDFAKRGGSRLGTPDRSIGNQVILTSRIVGYHATPLDDHFLHLLLAPLSADASREVVDFWLAAYSGVASLTESERSRLADALASLIDDGAARFGGLVANPFLLVSAISGVASGRIDVFQHDRRWLRSDLYDAALEDAVTRARRRFPDRDVASITKLQMAVAARLHEQAPSGVVERAALDEVVATAMEDVGLSASVDEAVTAVLDGLGLITERGQGLYGFLHLSVGEHLAGLWITRDDDAAERIAGHLGDPRWVEPIRLGLAHLSRHEPERFASVVGSLLGGDAAWAAALLLVSSVDDLDHLDDPHIAALVAALTTPPSGTSDESVRLLVRLAHALQASGRDGQAQYERVASPLGDAIRSGEPVRASIAAEVAHILQLRDPAVLLALYEVQEQDGPKTQWTVTTTLQALLSLAGAHDDLADVDVDEILRDLRAEERVELERARVETPRRSLRSRKRRRPARQAGRGGLPRERMPMQKALLAEPDLFEHTRQSTAWTRLMVCLYGGCDYSDLSRWRQERDDLEAQLEAPTSTDADRRLAAQRLDTEVVPRLQLCEEAGIRFQPELISVESPLTPLVLEHLRRRAQPDDLAEALVAVSADPARPAIERGDAIAGWAALASAEQSAVDALSALGDGRGGSGSDATAEVRQRVAWRLGRALVLVEDVLARVPVGNLVTAVGDNAAPGGSYVLPSLGAITRPRAAGFTEPAVHLHDYLLAAVAGWSGTAHEARPGEGGDRSFNLAVALDTLAASLAGAEGTRLVNLLGSMHLAPGAVLGPSGGWQLDALGPRGAPVVAEALTTIGRLPSALAFVACWSVARMAPVLARIGYGEEAAALVLDLRPAEREGALTALYALARAGLDLGVDVAAFGDWVVRKMTSDVELPQHVDDALRHARERLWTAAKARLASASRDDDRYPAVRGVLRLGGGTSPSGVVSLVSDGVSRLARPMDRLRAAELAHELGIDFDDVGSLAVRAAEELEWPEDRALAFARLARWTGGEQSEQLLQSAVDAVADIGSDDERATVLARLRAPVAEHTTAAPRWNELVAAIRSPRLRAQARGWLADELLAVEHSETTTAASAGVAPSQDFNGDVVAWAGLTLGAVAHDGLEVLEHDGEPGSRGRAALWHQLMTGGGERERIADALLDRGAERPWELTPLVAGAIDALIAGGDDELAARLLAVVQAPSDPRSLERWRASEDHRVADRATMLAIEGGRLDERAVSCLPRLLEADDDRVRIRTELALSVVSRGLGGRPRFKASTCGAGTVTALVREYAAALVNRPQAASELSWCLSDIVFDTPEVLEQTLASLGDERTLRRTFLRSIRQLDARTASEVLHLAGELGDDELTALLASIASIAENPPRAGLTRSDLRPLVPSLFRLASSATTTDATAAAAVSALGELVDEEAELEELERFLEDDAAPVAANANLAVATTAARIGNDERRADLLEEFREEATTAGGERAVTGAAAIVRLGEPLEYTGTDIAAPVVLRGMLTSPSKSVAGEQYHEPVRRAARYVLEPAHLTGVDAAAHTERLVAGVVSEVTSRLRDVRETRDDPDYHALRRVRDLADEDDLLALLAEVGTAEPATLRQAVGRTPELPPLLADHVQHSNSWLGRMSAITVLATLGNGDYQTITALLAAAADTGVVSDAAVNGAAWIEEVDSDAFQLLLSELDDPRAVDASTAAGLLVSLAEQNALDTAQRRQTVTALEAVTRSASPGRRIVREQGGRLVPRGTLAGAFSNALATLVGGGTSVARSDLYRRALVLDVPVEVGPPVTFFVAPGVLPSDPFDYQRRYYRDHRRERPDPGVLTALERLGTRCRTGAALADAVAHITEPGAHEDPIES